MKKKIIKAAVVSFAAALSLSMGAAMSAYADWEQVASIGDINDDGSVSVADIVALSQHLLGQSRLSDASVYDMDYASYFISDGAALDQTATHEIKSGTKYLQKADINQDGVIDAFDLSGLRKLIVSEFPHKLVFRWYEEPETTATTTVTTTEAETTTTTTTTEAQAEFISPPLYDLYGSLPSQGEANLLVFYVDFPDCKYDYDPSVSEIEKICFGEENKSDSNYPWDSMSAFYSRSSKGAMELQGKAFRYTTKNNKSAYEGDVWHVALIDEIVSAYSDEIDFSQYDGDKDKILDAILISVPTNAGDDDWWPAAGGYGGNSYRISNGMQLGHVIVGNAQIKSAKDHSDFVSSYLHEMGHCMGLPDYYLYNGYTTNQFGLNGSAGFEMMDDAVCDFGALSKLMLGWYKTDQISVYDSSLGAQTYTLNNAQGSDSNCVIIPCGELADNYWSEFFIIEYATLDGNNADVKNQWWRATGEGVRIYHAEATNNGNRWYNYWKYASGEDEATDTNAGRRFIRLVGETSDNSDNTDNFFTTGAVVNSSTVGFQWYDSKGKLTVDPGITVTIGEKLDDTYTITITAG